MKCDFNCNHVHSQLKLPKPDAIKGMESCTPAHTEDSCKDCVKEYQRLSYRGFQNANPRIVELKAEGRPVNNKENHHKAVIEETSIVYEENDRLFEDSGYSSFSHQSILSEHEYSDLLLKGNLCVSPKPRHLEEQAEPAEPTEHLPNKNLLPVCHFEEVVCSTLKRNSSRNPRVDWDTVERVVSHGNFGLQNIIGRKMGLDQLDVLGELFQRGLKHLLASILKHLNEMDLINVAKVSTTWKKILEDDREAFQVYNKAVKKMIENNTKLSAHASTREYILLRTALASVQKATLPSSFKKPPRAKASSQSNQNGSTYSRHVEFSEIAKTLKKNESLRPCHRCGSPAKVDSYLDRATCSRESCGFDFCTKCLCSYHITKDCNTTSKLLKANSKTGPLPGSKKSKKNLRRL
ncbi:F-box only protein 5 [Ornithorhynchus anatinus]|nr:F-box only protein 5 [Ornithorhynchus anatinus]